MTMVVMIVEDKNMPQYDEFYLDIVEVFVAPTQFLTYEYV
eukprot:CAMPEP_0170813246 /NCGR_PEP_ID=MMETSP0733-20121128/36690_1 /TAXON_ID=186038 /ORGANISM="Fragilariopsis kerguelensis, Strain L26-C5" /LENGTH=39 /DNA_ID= /DNA_START= /DNA_END= /DNA_ORIENTATION=